MNSSTTNSAPQKMLEKETVKLEDSLTAMIRITKENEEIDRKTEIEKIKQQAKKEVQQLEEVKNTKIIMHILYYLLFNNAQ